MVDQMNLRAKYWRLLLTGLGILVVMLGCFGIILLKRLSEFRAAEEVEGHWASLQNFVKMNGRYPKDEEEIGAFFHEAPEELKQEPVKYIVPHGTNGDEVILWCKSKTIFGVRIGVTESGTIVKQ
jgi:hypothetical protein